jgi:hypothetical protein
MRDGTGASVFQRDRTGQKIARPTDLWSTPHDQSTAIFLNRTLGLVVWWKSKDLSSKLLDKGTASLECSFDIQTIEVSVPPKTEDEIGEPYRRLDNDLTARVICSYMLYATRTIPNVISIVEAKSEENVAK